MSNFGGGGQKICDSSNSKFLFEKIMTKGGVKKVVFWITQFLNDPLGVHYYVCFLGRRGGGQDFVTG